MPIPFPSGNLQVKSELLWPVRNSWARKIIGGKRDKLFAFPQAAETQPMATTATIAWCCFEQRRAFSILTHWKQPRLPPHFLNDLNTPHRYFSVKGLFEDIPSLWGNESHTYTVMNSNPEKTVRKWKNPQDRKRWKSPSWPRWEAGAWVSSHIGISRKFRPGNKKIQIAVAPEKKRGNRNDLGIKITQINVYREKHDQSAGRVV